MRTYLSVLCFFGSLLLVLGCVKTDETKKPNACDVRNNIYKQLHDLAKDKSCNTVSDCKYIGYGSTIGCGSGSYLIYSELHTDIAVLSAKIEEYNSQNEECAKIANGTAGPCVVTPEPVLSCLLGTCIDSNP